MPSIFSTSFRTLSAFRLKPAPGIQVGRYLTKGHKTSTRAVGVY
jgi:hypothetical protein